jgi:hypothetical protein
MLFALRRSIPLLRPPRALSTGQRNFQIAGPPDDERTQTAILRRALRVLVEATEPATVAEMDDM